MKIPVFVVMPFGKKRDKIHNYVIDFDDVYNSAILPALNSVNDIVSIREDSELFGGIIHRTMYEKLVCTDIVLADLSNENPNVFYELGIRHAARPCSNILICNKDIEHKIPFDISPLRIVFYKLVNGKLLDTERQYLSEQIQKRLQMLLKGSPATDSPLYELIPEFPNIDKTKTQLFRDYFEKCSALYRQIEDSSTAANLKELEQHIENLPGTKEDLINILRLFIEKLRSLEEFSEIVNLIEKYREQKCIQNEFFGQQYAIALNRVGQAEKAVNEIRKVIATYGESPESYGILGRIYKDKYTQTSQIGYLDKAIEAYERGFNLDIRDYYPGVNLATLLLRKGDADSISKMKNVITILQYTLSQNQINSDVWQQCSFIEILCLQQNWETASLKIESLLAMLPKPSPFVLNTLKNNLSLIRQALKKQGISTQELQEIIGRLQP